MVQLYNHKEDPSLLYYKFDQEVSSADIEMMYQINSHIIKKLGKITLFVNMNNAPIIDLNIITQTAKSVNASNGAIREAIIFNLSGLNLIFVRNMINLLKSTVKKYYKVIEYLSKFTTNRMGLIIGVDSLMDMFEEKYYINLNCGIMEAFGIIFSRDIKIYLYPYKPNSESELLNSNNIPIHPRVKALYEYLYRNKRIDDLNYKKEVLSIFHKTMDAAKLLFIEQSYAFNELFNEIKVNLSGSLY